MRMKSGLGRPGQAVCFGIERTNFGLDQSSQRRKGLRPSEISKHEKYVKK